MEDEVVNCMVANPLKKTNPYMRDKRRYEEAVINNVITSSAVEGIMITKDKLLKKCAATNKVHL